MKRIFIVILSLVLLCGCTKSGYLVKRCVENQNSHSFSMRYGDFDGTRRYTIRTDSSRVAVAVEVETTSGELAITIARDGGESVYTGNQLPTTGFTVYLDEPGTYIVTVTAQHHHGSFSFDWGQK